MMYFSEKITSCCSVMAILRSNIALRSQSLKMRPELMRWINVLQSPLQFSVNVLVLIAGFSGMNAYAFTSEVAQHCNYVNLYELPISFSGASLLPTIKGSINNKPVDMVMSIGSFQSFLNLLTLKKLGVPTVPTGSKIIGTHGEKALRAAQVNEISFGPVHTRGITLEVIDEQLPLSPYGATIGADVLLRTDLEIAIADKKVTFFRADDACKDAFLGYWDPNTSAIPFKVLGFDNVLPVFEVTLNGNKVSAILSTTTNATIIDLKTAKMAGLTPNSPGVEVLEPLQQGSSKIDLHSGVFNKVVVGGETINNARLLFANFRSTSYELPEMVLGLDFLRSHRVLISKAQHLVYISYLGGPVFSEKSNNGAPWFQQEAEDGNSDAQISLGQRYESGEGVPIDIEKATAWYQKAADQGNLRGHIKLARVLYMNGRFSESAMHWHQAESIVSKLKYAPILSFLARTRAGDAPVALKELEAHRSIVENEDWPTPILDLYLGRSTSDAVFKDAERDPDNIQDRVCEANFYVAEWFLLQGKTSSAIPLLESARLNCSSSMIEKRGATLELERIAKN